MQLVLQKTHTNGLLCLDDKAYAALPNNFVVDVHKDSTRGMSMRNLWWSWMGSTAEFMANNGATMPLMISKDGKSYGQRRFSKEDAHELFTSQWMGTDENGVRYSWKTGSPTEHCAIASKALRLHAMEKHQAWCTERGINLLNPKDSEFSKLKDKQEI